MNDHVKNLKPVPPIARPAKPAHIIRSDAEAIEVAKSLAAEFAERSSLRDRNREWPAQELDAFSQSGLWSLNVPKAFGGPELSYATLSQVVAIISAADSSIGQISQNHIGVVAAIRTVSDEAQQKLLFAEVLKGTRFGNAFSEFGSKRAADFETRFEDKGDHVVVTGRKFYATGALLAHLVPIVAIDAASFAHARCVGICPSGAWYEATTSSAIDDERTRKSWRMRPASSIASAGELSCAQSGACVTRFQSSSFTT